MNITDEMVERAAKAIYEHTNVKPTVQGIAATWEQYKKYVSNPREYLVREKQTAFDQARAALEAALGDVEPLEDMVASRDRFRRVVEAMWPFVDFVTGDGSIAELNEAMYEIERKDGYRAAAANAREKR